jgi:hypothetical protein
MHPQVRVKRDKMLRFMLGSKATDYFALLVTGLKAHHRLLPRGRMSKFVTG